MGDMLSQAEINALLGNKGDGDGEAQPTEYAENFPNSNDEMQDFLNNSAQNADDLTLDSNAENSENIDGLLSDSQKDILGEIGNISMGTSATTMFAILNRKVSITTPNVKIVTWGHYVENYDKNAVGIRIDYKDGIVGSNFLILKQRDVKIISDIMMGGDAENIDDSPPTDIELSAISEAMNQMVGSSATTLSNLMETKIDIETPKAFLLDFDEPRTHEFFQDVAFDDDTALICTVFRMQIGDIVDSEVMQVFTEEFALKLIDKFSQELSDNAPKVQQQPKLPPKEPVQQAAPIELQQSLPQQGTPIDLAPNDFQGQNQAQQMQYAGQNQQQAQMPNQVPYQNMNQGVNYMSQQNQNTSNFAPNNQQINVTPVQFQSFDESAIMQQKENIGIIMDVPLEVTVELGRTHREIKEILEFSPGTVIELDKLAGEPIDILVNNKFVAKGEVVVIDENFAVRITEIINVENRI